MTDAPGPDDTTSPAPPTAAAQPWTEPDRPRGLDAYFPPGGEDDAPEERRRDERRMLFLLVTFVAALVIIPTVLTIIGFASELLTMHGGG